MIPVAPAVRVETRIAARLAGKQRAAEVRYVWWALPIAAALALLAARWTPPHPAGAHEGVVAGREAGNGAAFRPVAAENVLLSSKEEGFVTLADGTPARQIRMAYLDTITWRNPTTKASLSWTIPREEVRIVPVSYQ